MASTTAVSLAGTSTGFQVKNTYATSGNFYWTIPSGCTSLVIKAWGAGGASGGQASGGGGSYQQWGGSGGGGSSYAPGGSTAAGTNSGTAGQESDTDWSIPAGRAGKAGRVVLICS